MALTEYSATAPLKLQAAKYGFRAATMPGFSSEMIPALRLDYEEINRRVMAIKEILDEATGLEIEFITDGDHRYRIHFDLRFRKGHASGGRFPQKGSAGNLPSGESYIVPYEGEKGEASLSEGTLPVQFEDEIVLYKIERNTAVEILSKGSHSEIEAQKIKNEPAYANISEIGFGVLSDFGISPIGEILLDEKLGLHIAFGRSDHFGGAIGIKDFTSPDNVVHIDRIYIPETQNRVNARSVKIINRSSRDFHLMENGNYTIF
jgi:leucyl aminopeptidase (aminopeptidase T)